MSQVNYRNHNQQIRTSQLHKKKALKEWRVDDFLVTNWLLNSMEPTIADLCMCAGSARAVWQKLEKRYGQKNNYAQIYQLQTEIHQAR
jgi:hypothetical protein